MIMMDANPGAVLRLGFSGENDCRTIRFSFADWARVYGPGVAALVACRYGENDGYAVPLEQEGDVALWTLRRVDTALAGTGWCELQYRVGDVVVKRERWATEVEKSPSDAYSDPESPDLGYLEQILEAGAQTLKAQKEVQSDRKAADMAAGSAASARDAAQVQARNAANSAREALAAKKAVEELEVSAHTLDSGDEASVEKVSTGGGVKLLLGIPRGADGVSPTAEVEEIEGGHRVTITDGKASQSFDVMDGKDGVDSDTRQVWNTDLPGTSFALDFLELSRMRGAKTPTLRTVKPGDIVIGSDGAVLVIQEVKDIMFGQEAAPHATFGEISGYLEWYGKTGEDGKDGVSPTVSVEAITGGHRVSVTDAGGTKTFDVMDGAAGAAGPQGPAGPAGAAGVSAAVWAQTIDRGHRVYMTGAEGQSYFDVLNGLQGPTGPVGPTGPEGPQGPAGKDGLDGNRGPTGPEGPQGPQGPAGADGKAGVSPTVSVESITGGHRVTVTDGEGSKSFVVKDGKDGSGGTGGTGGGVVLRVGRSEDCDYICDGERDEEAINAAIAALPGAGGTVLLSDDTYNLGATIFVLNKNVEIVGEGGATLRPKAGALGVSSLIEVEASDCKLSNIVFDGLDSDGNSGSGYAGLSVHGTGAAVSDCTFRNFERGADPSESDVYGKAEDAVFERCLFKNCDRAFYARISDLENGIRVESCTVEDSQMGIYLQCLASVTNCVIRNCDVGLRVSEYHMNHTDYSGVVAGNLIYRGEGLSGDYTGEQHTVYLSAGADHVIVAGNTLLGKDVTNDSYGSHVIVERNWYTGGKDGKDGADGKDGVSPTVAVEEIEGGHRVTVNDAQSSKSFDVMDGKDGSGGGGGVTSWNDLTDKPFGDGEIVTGEYTITPETGGSLEDAEKDSSGMFFKAADILPTTAEMTAAVASFGGQSVAIGALGQTMELDGATLFADGGLFVVYKAGTSVDLQGVSLTFPSTGVWANTQFYGVSLYFPSVTYKSVKKLDNKYIDAEWMAKPIVIENVTIIPELEAVSSISAPVASNMGDVLKAGGIYTVVFDGTEYTCEAKMLPSGMFYIGNGGANFGGASFGDLPDTGEPFLLVMYTGTGTDADGKVFFLAESKESSHTLSVRGSVKTYPELPEEYLPASLMAGERYVTVTKTGEAAIVAAQQALEKSKYVYFEHEGTKYTVLKAQTSLGDPSFPMMLLADMDSDSRLSDTQFYLYAPNGVINEGSGWTEESFMLPLFAKLNADGKIEQKYLPDGEGGAIVTVGRSSGSGYDYVCDGTDDQVEILAAINSLPSTGGKVVLGYGTYNISEALYINKKNVTIVGEASATLKRAVAATNYTGNAFFYVTAFGCTLRNLVFDGAIGTYAGDTNACLLVNSSDATVTECTFQNTGTGAQVLLADALFERCIFKTCRIGITGKADGFAVEDSRFEGASFAGVYMEGSNKAKRCVFRDCATGVYLATTSYSSGNWEVMDNLIYRGSGTEADYTADQHTVYIAANVGKAIVTGNVLLGKDVTDESGKTTNIISNGAGSADGDCIPVPNTAEVGQTIAVKAVDANGKPTAWEAVDMASGGGEKEWNLICAVDVEADVAAGVVEWTFTDLSYTELWFIYKNMVSATSSASGLPVVINGVTTNQQCVKTFANNQPNGANGWSHAFLGVGGFYAIFGPASNSPTNIASNNIAAIMNPVPVGDSDVIHSLVVGVNRTHMPASGTFEIYGR